MKLTSLLYYFMSRNLPPSFQAFFAAYFVSSRLVFRDFASCKTLKTQQSHRNTETSSSAYINLTRTNDAISGTCRLLTINTGRSQAGRRGKPDRARASETPHSRPQLPCSPLASSATFTRESARVLRGALAQVLLRPTGIVHDLRTDHCACSSAT